MDTGQIRGESASSRSQEGDTSSSTSIRKLHRRWRRYAKALKILQDQLCHVDECVKLLEDMRRTQSSNVLSLEDSIKDDMYRLNGMIQEVVALSERISTSEVMTWMKLYDQFTALCDFRTIKSSTVGPLMYSHGKDPLQNPQRLTEIMSEMKIVCGSFTPPVEGISPRQLNPKQPFHNPGQDESFGKDFIVQNTPTRHEIPSKGSSSNSSSTVSTDTSHGSYFTEGCCSSSDGADSLPENNTSYSTVFRKPEMLGDLYKARMLWLSDSVKSFASSVKSIQMHENRASGASGASEASEASETDSGACSGKTDDTLTEVSLAQRRNQENQCMLRNYCVNPSQSSDTGIFLQDPGRGSDISLNCISRSSQNVGESNDRAIAAIGSSSGFTSVCRESFPQIIRYREEVDYQEEQSTLFQSLTDSVRCQENSRLFLEDPNIDTRYSDSAGMSSMTLDPSLECSNSGTFVSSRDSFPHVMRYREDSWSPEMVDPALRDDEYVSTEVAPTSSFKEKLYSVGCSKGLQAQVRSVDCQDKKTICTTSSFNDRKSDGTSTQRTSKLPVINLDYENDNSEMGGEDDIRDRLAITSTPIPISGSSGLQHERLQTRRKEQDLFDVEVNVPKETTAIPKQTNWQLEIRYREKSPVHTRLKDSQAMKLKKPDSPASLESKVLELKTAENLASHEVLNEAQAMELKTVDTSASLELKIIEHKTPETLGLLESKFMELKTTDTLSSHDVLNESQAMEVKTAENLASLESKVMELQTADTLGSFDVVEVDSVSFTEDSREQKNVEETVIIESDEIDTSLREAINKQVSAGLTTAAGVTSLTSDEQDDILSELSRSMVTACLEQAIEAVKLSYEYDHVLKDFAKQLVTNCLDTAVLMHGQISADKRASHDIKVDEVNKMSLRVGETPDTILSSKSMEEELVSVCEIRDEITLEAERQHASDDLERYLKDTTDIEVSESPFPENEILEYVPFRHVEEELRSVNEVRDEEVPEELVLQASDEFERYLKETTGYAVQSKSVEEDLAAVNEATDECILEETVQQASDEFGRCLQETAENVVSESSIENITKDTITSKSVEEILVSVCEDVLEEAVQLASDEFELFIKETAENEGFKSLIKTVKQSEVEGLVQQQCVEEELLSVKEPLEDMQKPVDKSDEYLKEIAERIVADCLFKAVTMVVIEGFTQQLQKRKASIHQQLVELQEKRQVELQETHISTEVEKPKKSETWDGPETERVPSPEAAGLVFMADSEVDSLAVDTPASEEALEHDEILEPRGNTQTYRSTLTFNLQKPGESSEEADIIIWCERHSTVPSDEMENPEYDSDSTEKLKQSSVEPLDTAAVPDKLCDVICDEDKANFTATDFEHEQDSTSEAGICQDEEFVSEMTTATMGIDQFDPFAHVPDDEPNDSQQHQTEEDEIRFETSTTFSEEIIRPLTFNDGFIEEMIMPVEVLESKPNPEDLYRVPESAPLSEHGNVTMSVEEEASTSQEDTTSEGTWPSIQHEAQPELSSAQLESEIQKLSAYFENVLSASHQPDQRLSSEFSEMYETESLEMEERLEMESDELCDSQDIGSELPPETMKLALMEETDDEDSVYVTETNTSSPELSVGLMEEDEVPEYEQNTKVYRSTYTLRLQESPAKSRESLSEVVTCQVAVVNQAVTEPDDELELEELCTMEEWLLLDDRDIPEMPEGQADQESDTMSNQQEYDETPEVAPLLPSDTSMIQNIQDSDEDYLEEVETESANTSTVIPFQSYLSVSADEDFGSDVDDMISSSYKESPPTEPLAFDHSEADKEVNEEVEESEHPTEVSGSELFDLPEELTDSELYESEHPMEADDEVYEPQQTEDITDSEVRNLYLPEYMVDSDKDELQLPREFRDNEAYEHHSTELTDSGMCESQLPGEITDISAMTGTAEYTTELPGIYEPEEFEPQLSGGVADSEENIPGEVSEVTDSEVDMSEEISDSEVNVPGEVTDSEVNLHEEVIDSEADMSGEFADSEVDAPEEVTDSVLDVPEEVTDSKVDLPGEVTDSEVDMSGEFDDSEVDVPREVTYSEVDTSGEVEDRYLQEVAHVEATESQHNAEIAANIELLFQHPANFDNTERNEPSEPEKTAESNGDIHEPEHLTEFEDEAQAELEENGSEDGNLPELIEDLLESSGSESSSVYEEASAYMHDQTYSFQEDLEMQDHQTDPLPGLTVDRGPDSHELDDLELMDSLAGSLDRPSSVSSQSSSVYDEASPYDQSYHLLEDQKMQDDQTDPLQLEEASCEGHLSASSSVEDIFVEAPNGEHQTELPSQKLPKRNRQEMLDAVALFLKEYSVMAVVFCICILICLLVAYISLFECGDPLTWKVQMALERTLEHIESRMELRHLEPPPF